MRRLKFLVYKSLDVSTEPAFGTIITVAAAISHRGVKSGTGTVILTTGVKGLKEGIEAVFKSQEYQEGTSKRANQNDLPILHLCCVQLQL